MENSHRIRCVAYDKSFFTEPGQLPRPSSFPENSKIAWTVWDWTHHCIIAAWEHDSFKELEPYSRPHAVIFEKLEVEPWDTQ